MEQLNASHAKREFGELLLKAQVEPIAINKNGKPVAVIVSAKEFQELEDFKERILKFAIAEGIEDLANGEVHKGSKVFEELKKKINAAI